MATWLDGVIAALIAVVFLSWGLHIVSSLKSTPESGLARLRMRAYLGTIALQWTFVVAIAVMGLVRGTPWAALGLAPSLSLPFWIVFAILAVSLYPLVRWRARLLAKEENLEKIRHMANGQGPGRLFPKCRWELALFYAMSVSSGTTEELLFRGFLIWYFHHWLALWPSALLSTIIFGLDHLYQGWSGALQAGVMGAIFALLYLCTGSLVISVLLHILINLHQAHAVQAGLRYAMKAAPARA